MRKWFRSAFYLYITIEGCLANAGSYEDFFIAVKRNDGRAITALTERGFDPNTRGPQGEIGLVSALQAENLAAAEALFARPEIRLDLTNASGESALMMAALRGDYDWTVRLLARGAPLDKPGWSPLHYAASGPEPRIVGLLLERGARVDAESPDRTTPLMMAARYGKEESVKLLLARGADAKRTNDRNMNAADFARGSGRDWLAAMLSRPGS
jgi:ankyrin repeat protein